MFARGRRNQEYERVNRSSFDGPDDFPLNPLVDEEQPLTPKPTSKPTRSLLHYVCANPFKVRWHTGRQRWKRVVLRCLFFFFLTICALVIITPIFNPSYSNRPSHYSGKNPLNETVFIAANIIDPVMIRGPWGKAVTELVQLIGPNNVFLSVYENDSGEETKAALQELKQKLKCKSNIISGHIDRVKFPTVQLLPNDKRVKRITYLADVRNKAIDSIEYTDSGNITETEPHRNFDKLLFLNDVVFSARDAADLLFATNIDETGRTNYNAVCAMDYINPIKFYDRFAMRDNEYYETGIPFFPWFIAGEGKSESWHDVMAEKDAVRVKSCWGGMVAFEAKWFRKDTLQGEQSPLRFRSEPDTFWDASECCLIHADLGHLIQQSGQETPAQIFVNPFVRVSYDANTFGWLEFTRRFERLFTIPHMVIGWFLGMPWSSSRRLEVPGQPVKHKEWTYLSNFDMKGKEPFTLADMKHFGTWNTVEQIAKPGGFCGFPFLLALKNKRSSGDRYWEKIFAPPGGDG